MSFESGPCLKFTRAKSSMLSGWEGHSVCPVNHRDTNQWKACVNLHPSRLYSNHKMILLRGTCSEAEYRWRIARSVQPKTIMVTQVGLGGGGKKNPQCIKKKASELNDTSPGVEGTLHPKSSRITVSTVWMPLEHQANGAHLASLLHPGSFRLTPGPARIRAFRHDCSHLQLTS